MTQNLRKGNTFSQICVASSLQPAGVPDAVPGTVQYTLLIVLRVLLPRTLHNSHAVKISRRCKSACVHRGTRRRRGFEEEANSRLVVVVARSTGEHVLTDEAAHRACCRRLASSATAGAGAAGTATTYIIHRIRAGFTCQ